jgi:hypothetical protein
MVAPMATSPALQPAGDAVVALALTSAGVPAILPLPPPDPQRQNCAKTSIEASQVSSRVAGHCVSWISLFLPEQYFPYLATTTLPNNTVASRQQRTSATVAFAGSTVTYLPSLPSTVLTPKPTPPSHVSAPPSSMPAPLSPVPAPLHTLAPRSVQY